MNRARSRARSGHLGGTTYLYRRLIKGFSTGRNGFLYSLAQNTLNQLSTGTTPVTAATNPVGLTLDSRLGLALGAELVTNGGFDADASWTKGVGWTIAGGKATHAAGAGSDIEQGAVSLVAGKAYKITLDVLAVRAASILYAWDGALYKEIETVVSVGSKTAIIVMAANTSLKIRLGLAADADIDNISVKLLEGNHAIQATAGARPTWEVDAQGFHYLAFTGSPMSLTSATGGAGSAGFFFCAVVQPTGGAGTLQTLFADNGTNTGYKVQKDVNNKLSFSAGNNAAFTTLASTAALSVGTKYLLTVWDDGTNLNVQIDAVAAETVARPVVVAGTAGYTIGKDNGAASSYFIGYQYPPVYWKDTAGTAAERANAQAYCRAMGGM